MARPMTDRPLSTYMTWPVTAGGAREVAGETGGRAQDTKGVLRKRPAVGARKATLRKISPHAAAKMAWLASSCTRRGAARVATSRAAPGAAAPPPAAAALSLVRAGRRQQAPAGRCAIGTHPEPLPCQSGAGQGAWRGGAGLGAGTSSGLLTGGGQRRAQEGGHGADLGGRQLLLDGCVLVRVAADSGG